MLLRRKNDGYVWIGLNDIDREGNFVWADGSPGKAFSSLASKPINFRRIRTGSQPY